MNLVRNSARTGRSRRLSLAAVGAVAALTLAGCGGSGFDNNASGNQSSGSGSSGGAGASGSSTPSASNKPITVLIGSSGDAETNAVKKAVSDWSAKSGIQASVQVASDLNQQLAQGFAGGEPPDVFYLSTDQLAAYASNGSLDAYADQLKNADSFFPALKQAFTYNGKFWCAPKDFSTLALVINTKLWKAAGLTDSDIPTTWDQLHTDAKKLTKNGQVGLAFNPEYQRVGVFFQEAGGGLTNAEGTQATVNSPENVKALTFVKQMITDGSAAFSSAVGAGWGGEAFGKEKAAMTIEGNWIVGAMQNDYPKVDYKIVKLPAGPAGPGTLQYTNCWGIASGSDNVQGAIDLVEQLTSPDQELAFAKAFGVMPSVKSVADQWKQQNPKLAAFIDSADFAGNLPAQKGAADVIGDLNAKLAKLKSSDPKQILDSVQKNMAAVITK